MFINIEEWLYLVAAIFTGSFGAMMVAVTLLLFIGSNKKVTGWFTKRIIENVDLEFDDPSEK